MAGTIQQALQRHYLPYARQRAVSPEVARAVWCLEHCRTATLGAHTAVCENGHLEGVWYNSCRHRFCPQCSLGQIEDWLESQLERLLDVDHHHVILTIPHELLPLWQWNRRWMGDHLLRCAAETLLELLEDHRYCGGKAGVIVALHTWSRTLALHPHVHALVTAGGLSALGRWQPAKKELLLPVGVVRSMFRGKLLAGLARSLQRGALRLPPDLNEHGARQLLARAAAHAWNLRIEPRYRHGHGVVKYLGRYVRGGPLKNQQIRTIGTDTVVFRAKGGGLVRLSPGQFLRRLLEHVPPRRQHQVRAYGLYHRSQRAHRATLRRVLARRGSNRAEVCCSTCGGRLFWSRLAQGAAQNPIASAPQADVQPVAGRGPPPVRLSLR